jgi:hypothetical protein
MIFLAPQQQQHPQHSHLSQANWGRIFINTKPESIKFILLDSQFLQCVCDWDEREENFIKVEGIIRQQIKA